MRDRAAEEIAEAVHFWHKQFFPPGFDYWECSKGITIADIDELLDNLKRMRKEAEGKMEYKDTPLAKAGRVLLGFCDDHFDEKTKFLENFTWDDIGELMKRIEMIRSSGVDPGSFSYRPECQEGIEPGSAEDRSELLSAMAKNLQALSPVVMMSLLHVEIGKNRKVLEGIQLPLLGLAYIAAEKRTEELQDRLSDVDFVDTVDEIALNQVTTLASAFRVLFDRELCKMARLDETEEEDAEADDPTAEAE